MGMHAPRARRAANHAPSTPTQRTRARCRPRERTRHSCPDGKLIELPMRERTYTLILGLRARCPVWWARDGRKVRASLEDGRCGTTSGQ
eukprot:2107193-Prymnesium_polylepis.1